MSKIVSPKQLPTFLADINQSESVWDKKLSDQAKAKLEQMELPTPELEAWKYSRLDDFVKKNFHLTHPTSSVPKINSSDIPTFSACAVIVFIDGVFSTSHSFGDLSMMTTWDRASSWVNDKINQSSLKDDSWFRQVNDAFISSGAILKIPKNRILTEPIHLVYLATDHQQGFLNIRNLILAESFSEAIVVEHYLTLSDGYYTNNVVTELFTEEQAKLQHIKLVEESGNSWHFSSLETTLASNSHFHQTIFNLNGKFIRNSVYHALTGSGAETRMNGLYIVDQQRHVDNHTLIQHQQPHTTSHESYKGILTDQGTGVFDGRIVVDIQAQKTYANQSNRNLLLSRDATINAKPQLEIYADDVKCYHGATVGQLDDNQLFYLQSRGIGTEFAKAMLTHAFAVDILSEITNEDLKIYLDRVILKQLHSPLDMSELSE